MAAQVEDRVKSFLCQLQAESGILDRIIYKNKNQHRRCSYFQYLLKVRRDLKLLHSAQLEELLDSCFYVITGRKAKQKANLLESLKRRKCDGVKFNFMERLHGAARLLSEVRNIMFPSVIMSLNFAAADGRAYTEGSYVSFVIYLDAISNYPLDLVSSHLDSRDSLMLLDVVSVFNEVSSLAQNKQSIKITHNGMEVFREYYPTLEEEVIVLECVWKTDKFVLVEKSGKGNILHQGGSSETVQTLGTSIKYQSINAFLQDDEFNSEKADEKVSEECLLKRKRVESPSPISNDNIDNAEQIQLHSVLEHGSENELQLTESTLVKGSSLPDSVTSLIPSSSMPDSVLNKRVAFISVKKNASSESDAFVSQVNDNKSKRHDDEENTLFRLFTEEETTGSIF
uniref:Nucleolus and neural progenitor protein-like N-terminal domain-containing protein n=1 Tax=Chenopodium quinoa TaxID=63459 RepID=A0A803L4G9_CHEQI